MAPGWEMLSGKVIQMCCCRLQRFDQVRTAQSSLLQSTHDMQGCCSPLQMGVAARMLEQLRTTTRDRIVIVSNYTQVH